MSMITYALMCYAVTAVVSLAITGIVVTLSRLMGGSGE